MQHKAQQDKTTEIKALIFDVGGVLFLSKKTESSLLTSYKELCLLLEGIDIPAEDFYDQTIDIYMKSSKGDITKKKTLDMISKIAHCSPKNIEDIFEKAAKNNVIENKELINSMRKLKGYKLGIISIQWPLTSDILLPKRYYDIFDSLVISCFDKVRKPDPQAFTLALKRLNVKAEQAIFVDDNKENLPPAQNLGMKTIHFKNNKKFFAELKRLGVK